MSARSASILLVLGLALLACRSNPLYRPDDDGGVQADGGSRADGGVRDGALADLARLDGCAGLDEASCQKVAGCVADRCQLCSCSASFIGCRGATEAPTPCPAVGCAQPQCCREASECDDSGGQCQVPPIRHGCGACFIGPSQCDDDLDCKSHGQSWICAEHPCSCADGIINSCQPGCTSDADCPEPERCGAKYRCEPRACSDAACTGNYACGGTVCVRKSCTKDADCAGYCVDGRCSRSLGECIQPVP